MAAFDLLVIGFAVSILAAVVKDSRTTVMTGDSRGPMYVAAAVIVTGLFCVADLTTMFILPFSLGEKNAYMTMEYLHLNVRWVVSAITVGLILIGVMRALSHRKRTAVALICLTTKLVHCEEHERRRIANYLHDHVGQSLAALRIKFDLLCSEGKPTGQTKDTRQFTELLDESIDQIENLTYELQPPVLGAFGVQAAIEWISNKFSREYNVRFDCIVEGAPEEINVDDAAILYRIARELMLNVIKHARTDSAWVTLRWSREEVSLEVKDEGVGYDPNNAETTGDGLRFGLASVRERIMALGGSYDVETKLGDGTRVALNLPLNGGAMNLVEAIT